MNIKFLTGSRRSLVSNYPQKMQQCRRSGGHLPAGDCPRYSGSAEGAEGAGPVVRLPLPGGAQASEGLLLGAELSAACPGEGGSQTW